MKIAPFDLLVWGSLRLTPIRPHLLESKRQAYRALQVACPVTAGVDISNQSFVIYMSVSARALIGLCQSLLLVVSGQAFCKAL